jgi:hypothetical protein
VPVVYYGDEQYLHNDTGGGNDPYDRNAMTSFGTTDAVTLIQYLAALRASNPAIAYGTMQQRWINDDVYIYERKLGSNVVLVAINKSKTNDQAISGLLTSLAPGAYSDYLNGTMAGVGLTVSAAAGGNNAVPNFTLPHGSVSIWVASGGAGVAIGSITPRVANPGVAVTIAGVGFGSTKGTANFAAGGSQKIAKIVRWTDGEITVTVPDVPAGSAQVTVTRGSTRSDAVPFMISTGKLIPVNFSVAGVPALGSGDVVMLTGNSAELGGWSTTWNGADGPAVIPSAGNALLTVSVPAGAKSQFKFFVLHADRSVQRESGSNHLYTIPASGVGAINVNWQP